MSAQLVHSQVAENGAAQLHHTGKFIENIDPEDPEYRRELQRPADVKEDMRQMESRQRVSSILNSQAFREELESIIADQLKHGPHPSSLLALQQISELLLPNTSSRWHQQQHQQGKSGAGSVLIPINDIRGIDTLNYAKGERLLRCKLAALYRIVDLYGWTSGISNHISVRLNQELDQFLVNPYGLLYHETTASSLVKVNSLGGVVEQGSSTYAVNKQAFTIHSAIYKARPDVRCVIHVHTFTTTAVSSMKCGLLPISQEAILCGNVSYHEFKGALTNDEDVRKLLAEDLGPMNKVLFLRNNGVIACGETIEEACFHLFNVIAACEIQSRTLVAGLENVHIPSQDIQRKMAEMALAQNESVTLLENKKWKIGELEFEALMRCLDNAGYRTGYMYRQPIMRNIDRSAVKDVEIPPAATSHPYDVEYVRKLKEEKSKVIKGEWLNSPNVYARTETEETGTPNPKKITKWVPESSPNKTSTPIRIENKHQFAPQGSDPKELKNHQKQIKQDRFDDKKTPGFQSRILEGIAVTNGTGTPTTADENGENGQQDSVDSTVPVLNGKDVHSTTTIVYGAASKGIIKRDQQNNAVVYKSYYAAANPFQQVDPNDLEKYKKEIAQKQLREQALKKNNLLKELLENAPLNKSEVVTSESKKKSHTIPRSKSLLDKKNEKSSDNPKSTTSGGGSQASTPQSSRDSSPSGEDKSASAASKATTTSPAAKAETSHSASGAVNASTNSSKSATIPASHHHQHHNNSSSTGSGSEKEKPKKKSKLSFLSRNKKSKDASQ